MGAAVRVACKQPPGVMIPVVNLAKCEGKDDCVQVCPENVFEIRRIGDDDYRGLTVLQRFKQRVHGMQVAYTPNHDACRSCGLCVSACPEHAITLARNPRSSSAARSAAQIVGEISNFIV